jgi:CubicO group peptidase (beta-lactamase class C family)
MRGWLLAGALLMSQSTQAQERPRLDAAQSDPVAMGWQHGSPPPADRRILAARGDHMRFPMTRYSFSNMRQFAATTRVSRGEGPVSALPMALRRDLDAVRFTPLGGSEEMDWQASLAANYTDGIVVLHQGRIVYERYFGVTRPDSRHIVFSVTKSFVGTIAEMLIAEGKLDPAQTVAHYLPELAASGFGDATVRQMLDMTDGVAFSEDYTDPTSGIGAFSLALGLVPRPAGYAGPGDLYAFLPGVGKDGQHGERFTYRSCNTEVLGWIIARLEGKPFAEVLSARIWQPLGMEADADFLIDPAGTAFTAGGLNMTLRDMARFGEALRRGGNGVIAPAAIASIRGGGRREHFAKANYPLLPGWTYRSQWWITHDPRGAFSARGIHGQAIYIDPVAEMVIARVASHPVAANAALDPTSLPAYRAIALKPAQTRVIFTCGSAANLYRHLPLPQGDFQ